MDKPVPTTLASEWAILQTLTGLNKDSPCSLRDVQNGYYSGAFVVLKALLKDVDSPEPEIAAQETTKIMRGMVKEAHAHFKKILGRGG